MRMYMYLYIDIKYYFYRTMFIQKLPTLCRYPLQQMWANSMTTTTTTAQEDFEFEIVLVLSEEEEFNKQRLRSKGFVYCNRIAN
jgi:hypothetical protein